MKNLISTVYQVLDIILRRFLLLIVVTKVPNGSKSLNQQIGLNY